MVWEDRVFRLMECVQSVLISELSRMCEQGGVSIEILIGYVYQRWYVCVCLSSLAFMAKG